MKIERWYDAQLRDLAAMEHGWDSYNAQQISVLAIRSVRLLLSTPPSIVPTTCGGIQLEWHTAAGYYELVIRPDGTQDSEGETAK